ncbi:hypothetical protein Tco_0690001 [Tanacetum coccineum]
MATHNRIYIAPFHTKKIFTNMRRQGKDFSRRETPLFPSMMVQAQEEIGEGSTMPTDPHHTPIITQPSSSQPQRKKKSRRPKEKDTCFIIVALELSKGANSLQAEDHNLWDVIVNGDLEEEPAPTTGETSAPPAPKTAKQLAARRNQERVKSILLLAIPDEYLLKFHNVADAKSLWEAIKSSLDKAYDRFQKLISQLEVHGAPISKEDINQKFLRSLPSSWNQIALIMRNKPDIDEIDIDDLYNNLRVYEDELKRSPGSNSASQNLTFLSSENTSSTNEVSTASRDFGVSTAGGSNQVPSTPCAHDVAYSFLA